MLAADKVKGLEGISEVLGFAPQHIFYLVQKADTLYTSIDIPKKSDPTALRTLDIPYSELKGVQRQILSKVLSRISVNDNVFSYVPGKSIVSAARRMCGRKAVLKIDISDFFPSITSRRVFGYFTARGFENAVAFILTKLCTKGGHLAQGAPTSPMLSNLISDQMDTRLEKAAVSWGMNYLRYSDDMFFYKGTNFNQTRFLQLADTIVQASGFQLNDAKTRSYSRNKPRVTLGLLTHNPEPRIPGPQRRIIRTMFFKASRNIQWANENKLRLGGTLEWYKAVHGKTDVYHQYRSVLDTTLRLQLHQSYQSN